MRWFGHVVRAAEGSMLREIEDLEVEGRKPRGRPKRRWNDLVKEDLRILNINEELAEDKELWPVQPCNKWYQNTDVKGF